MQDESQGAAAAALQRDLQAYFGGSQRTADDAFLERFLAHRLWAAEGDDKGDSRGHTLADADWAEGAGEQSDEAFSDKADDFEREYNFRCLHV